MNVRHFWKVVLAQDEQAIRNCFHEEAYVNWHCTKKPAGHSRVRLTGGFGICGSDFYNKMLSAKTCLSRSITPWAD